MNRPIEQRVAGSSNADSRDRAQGKKKFFALMAFFVLSFVFLAYTGVRFNGEFGRLEGTIVDSETQLPLEGAMVSIHGVFTKLSEEAESQNKMRFERAFKTEKDGRFKISTVKGRFNVVIELEGYKTKEVEVEMDRKQAREIGAIAIERSSP